MNQRSNEEFSMPMDEGSILLRKLYSFFYYAGKPAIFPQCGQILPNIDNLAEMILKDKERDERIGLSDFIHAYTQKVIVEDSFGKKEIIPNKSEIESFYKEIKNKVSDIGSSVSHELTPAEIEKLGDKERVYRILKAALKDTFKSIINVAMDAKYTNKKIELKKEAIKEIGKDVSNLVEEKTFNEEEFKIILTTYYEHFPEQVEKMYAKKRKEVPDAVKIILDEMKGNYKTKVPEQPKETPQFVPENPYVQVIPIDPNEVKNNSKENNNKNLENVVRNNEINPLGKGSDAVVEFGIYSLRQLQEKVKDLPDNKLYMLITFYKGE